MLYRRRKEIKREGAIGQLKCNCVTQCALAPWREMILSHLSYRVTRDDLEKGYKVHRRPRVKYLVLFGPIEVESPYLWNRDKKQGTRPVKNQLGITHGGRSLALEKALVDLGICQSYPQAAKQFEQHYGWSIDRYRIRRSVVKIAPQAQEYVSQRLESSRKEYNISLDVRPGEDKILKEAPSASAMARAKAQRDRM